MFVGSLIDGLLLYTAIPPKKIYTQIQFAGECTLDNIIAK